MEENCTGEFFEIYYQKPIGNLEFYCSYGNFSLENYKSLHYYDPIANSNYFIVRSISNFISAATIVESEEFWIDFQVPLNLKIMTIVFNSTNWIFYEKLVNLEKITDAVKMDSI